jgi:hypothetical protein
LWEKYVNFVFNFRNRIPKEKYYEIRYEDLLNDPETILRKILCFAEISVDDHVINETCKNVNRSRLNNSRYYQAFSKEIQSLPHSTLMERLGYSLG